MNHRPPDVPTDELSRLREKVARIMEGLEGCCMTCEPVGVRNQQMEGMLEVMREQVEHYVSERDEARREVCCLLKSWVKTEKDVALERGWDCYKEGDK